jgi:hypothetical protein
METLSGWDLYPDGRIQSFDELAQPVEFEA